MFTMSRFFYDTEFLEGKQKESFPMSLFRNETKPTIDLISIGIVSEDERYYYAVSKDFNLKEAWNRYDLVFIKNNPQGPEFKKVYWIRENVLKPIFRQWYAVHNNIDPTVFDHKFTYKEFKRLLLKEGKTNKQIAVEVKEFTNVIARDKFDNSYVTGEKVELYAYYGSYDHVALCWLFGKMIDLPAGFPMFTNDLKQMIDNKAREMSDKVCYESGNHTIWSLEESLKFLKDSKDYPKQENAHNALDDAKWNRDLYHFLKNCAISWKL